MCRDAARWVNDLHDMLLPSAAALPLMNKKVYQREQEVAAMRDAKYSDVGEFKDDMRSQRMRLKRGPSIE